MRGQYAILDNNNSAVIDESTFGNINKEIVDNISSETQPTTELGTSQS